MLPPLGKLAKRGQTPSTEAGVAGVVAAVVTCGVAVPGAAGFAGGCVGGVAGFAGGCVDGVAGFDAA